ncbi:hypothetical protein WA026_007694 [Henosepilachna vigintioctopunctata]|uniref:DUF243 domain-containing protein n=1 Tax=Henosepilachna vigintioctopunctata TaxID=420089 RepID=A0AAW1U5Y6_9CUCU
MKCLVIATLVACALSKPLDKPPVKRQFEALPFGGQSFQNQFSGAALPASQFSFDTQSARAPSQFLSQTSDQSVGINDASVLSNGASFDQTFSQRFGSLNNVQPEITNVGNTGLNSRTVSTTTAAPPSSFSIDYSNLPTSTVSPIFSSEVSSVSPITSDASFASLNALGNSQILSQGFSSTPLPDISSTFSASTFDSLNPNPTAIPIISSSALPSDVLQTRFGSNNLFLDNLNVQGLDLNSFNLNNYIDAGSNFHSGSNVVVNSDKAPEVTKSLYFYEAPEDLEPVRQRKIVQLPPQKTNYKILFIKAPSAPEPQPIEIPAQLQNNEKTRVYVLVKKPETEQEVRIVAAPTPKPERPEVFYIKYKTREEAEKAIKEAQAGAALGQQSINVEGHELVSKIKNAKVSHTGGSLLVKQTQQLPSVPLNLFESSTALPFISTTGSFGNIYDSSTVNSLLNNNNLNQFSLYNSPVVSSVVNPYNQPFSTSGNLFSNRNDVFSSGNNLFSSGNFGSVGAVNLSPSSSTSSRFSNTPTLIGLNKKFLLDTRIGQNSEDKKESSDAVSSSVDVSDKSSNDNSEVNSSVDSNSSQYNKDEPLQLSLGGVGESVTTSTAFTNAAESSSTTEASDVSEEDDASHSSTETAERK